MKQSFLIFGTLFLLFISNTAIAQSWTEKAELPGDARHHPICFAIGQYGYVTTGVNNSSFVLDDFMRFNASTQAWEVLTDFPGSVRGLGVGTQLDSIGYIGFGLNGNGPLDDLWKYDPVSDTWTELASCPCPGRVHPAFVALNGKIYVGLGDDRQSNLDDWWEYDIATDTWSQKADFPSFARHHPFYFAIGDYAYVGLGHGSVPVNGKVVYNDWYRYDPSNDTWTQLNDLPSQGRVAGTHFAYGGKGYILAGEDEDHANNFFDAEFWEYTPDTDSWVELDSIPIGDSRWAPGCFVVDSSLYFLAGENSEREGKQSQKDVWHYQLPSLLPPTDTTTNPQDSTNNPQDSIPANIATVIGDNELMLYPNPTNGVLTIKQNARAIEQVVIFDLSGRVIADVPGKELLQVDLSDQASGLYIVQVGTQRKKIVLE